MDILEIPRYRLHNQRLSKTDFLKPADVVCWFGAMQAQDYAGAKWAVGQRTRDATESTIEQAFADGSILRTHILRPTWHFVAPTDIRWMQKLTAPRVKAVNAFMERRLELDAAIFRRSHAALAKALQGGKHLTRAELGSALKQAGLPPGNGQRLSYLMMRAELDCVICSGARRGKQITYALLEERVPPAKDLERDEALAELTLRYFTSHGPATIPDFAWWSGLTTVDVKRGLDMVRSHLTEETIDGRTYWFSASLPAGKDSGPTACLLPNYDEYGIAYRDHSLICDFSHESAFIFSNVIVVKGQIIGTWRRTLKKESVLIEFDTRKPLLKAESQAVVKAAKKYGKFLGLSAVLP